MPISSSGASLERKKVFRIRGSLNAASTDYDKPSEKNFLTIEPALPVPECSRKLYKRSNSTLVPSLSKNNECMYTPITLHPLPDGTIHIFRTSQEKEKNPDRISLDRRGLTVLPVLDDEVNLRLLSLQHNLLNSLDGFRHQRFNFLVFLDVYDNQLEKIHCLDGLESLRVLLMGKNRIKQIEGLENLMKIEVLDLHGNQITHVNGLSPLSQLKVLNLAGNQIKNIGASDLKGLISLQEFNLRRNKLKKLLGFGETASLQKLFLSNNELHAVEDMCSLAKAISIREIAVDNNPISLGGDCVSFLVSYLPQLTILNGMQITDQVRKAAMAWRRNKEFSSTAFMDLTSDVCLNVRREEVISNARTNWELLRSQTKCLSTKTSAAVNITRNLKPDCDFILTSLTKPEFKSNDMRNKPRVIGTATKTPFLFDKRNSLARTSSQDSQNTSSSNTSNNEFFRLPPILVPIINKMDQQSEVVSKETVKSSGSLSSIGPNVDSPVSSLLSSTSSSSGESSDDEDSNIAPTDIVKHEETTPPDVNADGNSNEETVAVDNASVMSTSTLRSNVTLPSTSESDKSINSTTKPRSVKSAAVVKPCQSKLRCRPLTAKPKKDPSSDTQLEKDREQGGDYLIEICGRQLNIYGQGALRFIDKSWSMSKVKDVTVVNFNYINFNSIVGVLNKLKHRFPNTDSFVFKDTNIQYIGQLNALAEIQGLSSLVIETDGNSIVQKNWQSYAVYRLAHWGLRFINGKEISEEDIRAANEEYQSLSDIVLWTLPNTLLQPLLVRLQLDVSQKIPEQNAKKWLLSADPALRSVVIKEALQWKRVLSQDDLLLRQKAKGYIGSMLEETCNAVAKLRRLDEEWSVILHETVRNILLDYTQIDMYMKTKLQELKRL
ncbi:hypothetical protein PPYR_00948 [Photinus pyralis]|uniref:Dynein axonemal assembly factor 1 homolog n=6 Tax=Photinus pyralis TaxID=7054 RepID=A0A5N4B369_PHOPY|nr:leucine-rich repeat-containing protein 49 [Photinus pyralis]KAB0803978.1 hypothetical protein PPYR_00948 [Photinus pyralis]